MCRKRVGPPLRNGLVRRENKRKKQNKTNDIVVEEVIEGRSVLHMKFGVGRKSRRN